ncbi:MAG: tetrahydrofolate dehydrogenase/cyclohydrolase catalytic domain-containing protein, partial [Oscillospiraceae bacterium]
MTKIIDGKAISAAVKESVKAEVAELSKDGIKPGLAVIIVGADPASLVYVGSKKRACAELGMYSEEHSLPENTSQEELLALVECLNNRSDINGILCQLPLPRHLDEKAV